MPIFPCSLSFLALTAVRAQSYGPSNTARDTMRQTINIQTEGGEFTAYFAKPAGDLAPAIIVLHFQSEKLSLCSST